MPDFGRTATDYAAHRKGFPPRFYEQITDAGILRSGLEALDLGTGTGTLARGLALAGCQVIGLDIAPKMMEAAVRLDAEAGVSIRYLTAPSERTGLPDASFDLVTAGQCWHWFDGPAAAREIWRLLRPGGCVLIAHFDWLPLPDNVVEATEALILAFNSRWHMAGGNGFWPSWPSHLTPAGSREIETRSFDLDVLYSHEDWRGRIRASAGISASLSPERVALFDAAHKRMLEARFPVEPLLVPHRVWWLAGRKLL